MLENHKVIAKEMVNHNELLKEQNELIKHSNACLSQSAQMHKRIDDFNRMVYSATSGYQVPDDSKDNTAMKEFQETQQEEMSAVNDMYYSDISIGMNSGEE